MKTKISRFFLVTTCPQRRQEIDKGSNFSISLTKAMAGQAQDFFFKLEVWDHFSSFKPFCASLI